MAKLNHELLALVLKRKSLDGAFSKAKSYSRDIRTKKHAGGKTISHRNGKVERLYSKSIFIEHNLLLIRLTQDFLIKNNHLDTSKSLEHNIEKLGYTLNEVNQQIQKFKNECNIELIYDRKEGEYFGFMLFANKHRYGYN